MRVLILGGSGLISTETTRAVLELGHDATALTRGKTPFRVTKAAGREVKTVVGERQDAALLRKVLADVNPEAVIDLICYQPQEMRDLLAARNPGLRQIVFVSTVCALGGALAEHPAGARTECRPNSGYGRNKKELEEILSQAHASGDVAATTFRPSSTDGPGAWLSGSIWCRDPMLFRLLKARRPVPVCADVLCHHGSTRDVGRALALSAGRAACFGKKYQVVGDECITHAEWTRRSAEGLGIHDPQIVEIPGAWLNEKLSNWKGVGFLRDIWRFHGCFDTSELKRDIPEWRPELTVADNTRLTWQWAKDSGKWAAAQADFKPEFEPEPLCEAHARASKAFFAE